MVERNGGRGGGFQFGSRSICSTFPELKDPKPAFSCFATIARLGILAFCRRPPNPEIFVAHKRFEHTLCCVMQKQLNDAQDAEEEVNSSGADGSDQTYTDCDEQDEEIDAPLDAFGKPPWDREAGGSCKKLGGAARFRKGHGHRTRGGNEAVLSEEEIQGLLAEMTGVADQPEARCFGVQASNASDSSVTLSWRPPDKALGVDLLRYEVQQACLAEAPGRIDSGCGGVRRVTRGAVEQVSGLVSGLASGQDEATEGLKWVPILNQVDMLGRDLGTVCYCGWVVHGLCKDRFYRSGRVLRSAALTSGRVLQ